MNVDARCSKHVTRGLATFLLLTLGARHTLGAQQQPPQGPPPHRCQTSAEAHQFDFWIGKWVVTPWQVAAPRAGQQLGTSEVRELLEHCVLLENWSAAGNNQGKSWNYWDANVKRWRQLWMDEFGGALDYTGEFRDGAMRFVGWTLDAKGARVEQKLTFFRIAPDTVRQLFETSTDGGTSWTPGFDGRYVRRAP